jgi:hypothetical protein
MFGGDVATRQPHAVVASTREREAHDLAAMSHRVLTAARLTQNLCAQGDLSVGKLSRLLGDRCGEARNQPVKAQPVEPAGP